TPAAVASAASAPAAVTTTSAAPRSVLPRLRLVHRQPAALKLGIVQGVDRLLRPARHLDEAEAPTPAGLPVGDHLGLGHRPVLAEQLLQVGLGGAERQVPDVQILAGHVDPFPARSLFDRPGNTDWTNRDSRAARKTCERYPTPRPPAGRIPQPLISGCRWKGDRVGTYRDRE